MTLRNLSDDEQKELLSLGMAKVIKKLKDSGEVSVKTITLEAVYRGRNLLSLTSDFGKLPTNKAISLLLHLAIEHFREYTDIEDFIKTIISMWGTYDETEGNS